MNAPKSLRRMAGRPLREVADLIDDYMSDASGPVILHYKRGEGLVMVEPPCRISVEDIPRDATTLLGTRLSDVA